MSHLEDPRAIQKTAVLRGTATVDFGLLRETGHGGTNNTEETTITVTGAVVGDLAIADPAGDVEAGLTWCAFIRNPDEVILRIINTSYDNSVDPVSVDWNIMVFKY